MALRSKVINYFNNMILKAGFNLAGLNMCELGNQLIQDDDIPHRTAKEYYESLGVQHTSIDINGLDGAISLNFNRPIHIGTFDVVTNGGFMEHIKNQKQCLDNIHNLTKIGGIIIHIAPKIGSWNKHGLRHYRKKWFVNLAAQRNYKILDIGYINQKAVKNFSLIRCTYRRIQ